MHKPWMVYGANGYTGELIAREAARRGLKPILAGRNPGKIAQLANALDWQAQKQPTAAWAARYNEDFDAAMTFLDKSRRRHRNSNSRDGNTTDGGRMVVQHML